MEISVDSLVAVGRSDEARVSRGHWKRKWYYGADLIPVRSSGLTRGVYIKVKPPLLRSHLLNLHDGLKGGVGPWSGIHLHGNIKEKVYIYIHIHIYICNQPFFYYSLHSGSVR